MMRKLKDYLDFVFTLAQGTGLFSSTEDRLLEKNISEIKETFNSIQKKNGYMWRLTFAFEEGFLEQVGIAGEGFFHEDLLKDMTRKSMDEVLKKGGFKEALWVGEIHHNTDNPHIHIALIEPSLLKDDGFIPGIHRVAKSIMVNELMLLDHPEIKVRQQKINDLIREEIIPSRREEGLSLLDSKSQRQIFMEIFHRLPSDTRKWHYHMNALKEIRPLIDAYTKHYLSIHHAEEMKELENHLEEQVENQKEYYGDGDIDINFYKENRINDLYGRLVNVLLKEMADLHRELHAGGIGQRAVRSIFNHPKVKETMEDANKKIDKASKKYLSKIAYYKIKDRVEKNK